MFESLDLLMCLCYNSDVSAVTLASVRVCVLVSNEISSVRLVGTCGSGNGSGQC
jgi:hypothetical protein